MNRSFTATQLDRRANTLLRQVRNVPSGSEIIRELAEITIALEDAPVKPEVVARLTAFRKDGRRTIVEVYATSTYQSFYYFYVQQGNRRSTKQHTRVASRHEGISNGLITIAARLILQGVYGSPVVDTKLIVYKKRAYRRLLTISPDQIWRQS